MLTTKQKIRLARIIQAPLLWICQRTRGSTSVNVRRQHISWCLDLREGIDFSIFLLGSFERQVARACRRLTFPGAIVFDIGANIGAHALPLALRVGEKGRVYCFEPTAYAYEKLCANVALNPTLTNIEAFQEMVGSSVDSVPNTLPSSWPLDGRDVDEQLRAKFRSTDGARMTTIDKFVELNKITRLDLLKIDVDGYELSVLEGATDVLRNLRPKIITEIAPYMLARHGYTTQELCQLLATQGYTLLDLDGLKPLADPISLSKSIPRGAGANIVAWPSDGQEPEQLHIQHVRQT